MAGMQRVSKGAQSTEPSPTVPRPPLPGWEELPVVTEAIASIPVIGGVLDPQHFATQQHAGESKDGPWKELRVLGEGKLAYFQEVLLSQSG